MKGREAETPKLEEILKTFYGRLAKQRAVLWTIGCAFVVVLVSCVGSMPESRPLIVITAEAPEEKKDKEIGVPVSDDTVIAILPAQIIGYDIDWSRGIESAFSAELIDRGHSIVNVSDLDEILRVQELTLSGIVNDDEKRLEIGRILRAEQVLAVSAIWNSQYHIIDVRLTDVQTARVVFQRIYTTGNSTKDVLERGLRIIVAHMHGEEARSAVWESTATYQRDSVAQSIVERSRSLGTFRLCLVYAGLDGVSLHYQDTHPKSSSVPAQYERTRKIRSDVLRVFEQLYKTREFVFVYHLGSYKTNYSNEIVQNERFDIDYTVVRVLLEQQDSFIIFFGNADEAANALNNVSLTNRDRFYWAKQY